MVVFTTDFFPNLHVEKFKSTKVKQFCHRLKVIRKSVGVIIRHAVDAVLKGNKSNKNKAQNNFFDIPLKY